MSVLQLSATVTKTEYRVCNVSGHYIVHVRSLVCIYCVSGKRFTASLGTKPQIGFPIYKFSANRVEEHWPFGNSYSTYRPVRRRLSYGMHSGRRRTFQTSF